jgi:hypothetical protein
MAAAELSLQRRQSAAGVSQVSVSPADGVGITVGWLTHAQEAAVATWTVDAGTTIAHGSTTFYQSGSYVSDFINHATLPAPRGSLVSYTLDGLTFQARVPPPAALQSLPTAFAVVGDLGQARARPSEPPAYTLAPYASPSSSRRLYGSRLCRALGGTDAPPLRRGGAPTDCEQREDRGAPA